MTTKYHCPTHKEETTETDINPSRPYGVPKCGRCGANMYVDDRCQIYGGRVARREELRHDKEWLTSLAELIRRS